MKIKLVVNYGVVTILIPSMRQQKLNEREIEIFSIIENKGQFPCSQYLSMMGFRRVSFNQYNV